MLTTDRDLPVHILGPYVAAAAQAILDDEPLDTRATDALREAEQKLESQRAAALGSNEVGESTAALAPRHGGTALELASLVLDVRAVDKPATSRQGTVQEQMVRSSEKLAEVVDLLRCTEAGDKAAAQEVMMIFDKLVDRVFGRHQPADI